MFFFEFSFNFLFLGEGGGGFLAFYIAGRPLASSFRGTA